MGLTVSRKTAKNLAVLHKNERILTVSCKKNKTKNKKDNNNFNNEFWICIHNYSMNNKTKIQINYIRLQGVFDDQNSNKKKTLIFTKLAKNRYDRLKLKEQKALRSKTY